MSTTHHDDNATTWRDLTDQLTPEQIARFERIERLCMTAAQKAFPLQDRAETVEDIVDGILKEARWEAEQNLTDWLQFGHVPMPAGAERADHWEDDGTGTWTRRLSVSTRSVPRGGADSTVYVDGVQAADGTATWSLFILADDRRTFTTDEARQLAAMILEAADELDRLK